MWRWHVARHVPGAPVHLRPAALCTTGSARGNASQSQPPPPPMSKPLEEAKGESPPPPPRGVGGYLIGGMVVGLGGSLIVLSKSEDARLWMVDKMPMTKHIFDTLNLTTNPQALPQAPSMLSKDKKDKYSVPYLAEQSVTNLQVNKLETACDPCDPCQTRPKDVEPFKPYVPDTPEERKKAGEIEGVGVMQAAESSAKLLFAGKKHLTPEERAAKDKKDEAARAIKRQEQERIDKEVAKREMEKAEKQAALKLEKQKRIEESQRLAEEECQLKVKLNKELEEKLSLGIGQAIDLADAAVQANLNAMEISKQHANNLRDAMDAEKEKDAAPLWPVVRELNEKRMMRVEDAANATKTAEDKIVKILQIIDEAKANKRTKCNPNLSGYKKQVEHVAYDLQSTVAQLKKAETVSQIMKHYHELFRKDKENFKKELESIVPEVKIGETGLKMTEEELNSLLAHAHKRIFQLKRQLLEQQLLEQCRLQEALCEQMKADQTEAEERLERELKKQKAELDDEKNQALLEQSRLHEAELRRELARQASAHQDHLQDMLALQQKKLMEQFDMALRERLIHERHMYMDVIIKHMSRVKGLEAALEDRADMEKTITHVQALMTSSLGLMHALAQEDPPEVKDFVMSNLTEPLAACHQVADENQFVRAVLAAVPEIASERGVYTMSSLERRFSSVLKECKKRALYPKDEGMLKQWASRLYAYMVFWTITPKYYSECDFISPEGMECTELLVQAQYFLEKRCLASAVRCMVQLDGVPRTLAQDWIDEARLLLTVRQAAEALHAYASSKGMGTIF